MIEIKENFQLKTLNTFGIEANARFYTEIINQDDIQSLIQSDTFKNNEHYVLGGGSNILFTKDFDGLIIHPLLAGIEMIEETSSDVILKVGCGVVWDDFVKFSVGNNWGGIENLSYIPGNVGACPIQNIGAYGVEVGELIEKVVGIDLQKNIVKEFNKNSCELGYRDSVFKRHFKNNFLITYVFFRLYKLPHRLNTSYSAISKELENYETKDIASIREIVIKIRRSKLPETDKLGSAGSFFKNPVVKKELANKILMNHPDTPHFDADKGRIKLSAAWLIDRAGCKGMQSGDAATYIHQPLVIVNMGKAKGSEVISLAREIQEKVYTAFGVNLEAEVNML